MSSEETAVIAGRVFAVSNDRGNITPGSAQGLFFSDTRFLSTYVLKVNGESPLVLSAQNKNHDAADFYATNCSGPDLQQGVISIVRRRVVYTGLSDEIAVINHSNQAQALTLEIEFAADFADIFEVRGAHSFKKRNVSLVNADAGDAFDMAFTYAHGDVVRRTLIKSSIIPGIAGTTMSFGLNLKPKEEWRTTITVRPVITASAQQNRLSAADTECHAVHSHAASSKHQATTTNNRQEEWLASLPTLSTRNVAIKEAYDQAIRDITALRLVNQKGCCVPAAGLPWYLAVFGRDSLITALQTVTLGPDLAMGTLNCLAQYQARQMDEFREAEPGKIPHEIRSGELAHLDEIPHSRYYGTVDATPLYIVLLAEAYRWTGDTTWLSNLMPVAERAMDWIDAYGDLDGDGFVEYMRRTEYGLINQGWKDSTDCISFKSGELAQGPIALAEVQGYVYDAKVKLAGLHEILGHHQRAQELHAQAQELKTRFNQEFWLHDEGFYALALDGAKRKVDSITSNPGHCLWSGIIDERRAPQVVTRLLAEDLFSGWGIRTMSSLMARYNPISYHNGSVWPHDNSLIAAGLRRYGFHAEASYVALAVLEASRHFEYHRLPELFAGFAREDNGFPVSYPDANAPQAWASGAVISLIQTLLGLTPNTDGSLVVNPAPKCPAMQLLGLPLREGRYDVDSQYSDASCPPGTVLADPNQKP
jgi:glycogen debranching enzyme